MNDADSLLKPAFWRFYQLREGRFPFAQLTRLHTVLIYRRAMKPK